MGMSGVDLIRAERYRQIQSEGYSPEHDKGHHGELARAAACYALRRADGGSRLDMHPKGMPRLWPWDARFWRPKDEIRDLVRAGALIAAALDALIAAEQREVEPASGMRR